MSLQRWILFSFILFVNVNAIEYFEDGVIKMFTEDSGKGRFDSFEADNSTFLVIDNSKLYLPGVTVSLKITKLTMNEEHGDYLIVGPGNHLKVLSGAPGLMYVQSQENTQSILVVGKSATIVFVPRNSVDPSSGRRRVIEFEWKVNGTETAVAVTTQLPTTPMSEAEKRALILCFRNMGPVSCESFTNNTTLGPFKRELVNTANKYVEDYQLEIKFVKVTDIRVQCLIIPNVENETSEVNRRENNFLSLTITDSRNTDLPVFTREQLREIIKRFDVPAAKGVAECRTYPNYWWWFYGSAIILILILMILPLCWCYSKHESEPSSFREKKDVKIMDCNGIVNKAFQQDDVFRINPVFCDDPDGTDGNNEDLPPETPKRNETMDFPPTSPTVDTPINWPENVSQGASNVPRGKSPRLTRSSSKKNMPILPVVNEDKIRESTPSVASMELTVDNSREKEQKHRDLNASSEDSQQVYEEPDRIFTPIFLPLSLNGKKDDTLF